MNLETKEYVQNALKTESNDFEAIGKRLQDETTVRLLHGGIGLATESAEFLDMLKKHIFYGKPLDLVNLGEESADLLWYCAIICDALGKESFNDIMERNIEKLKARYGDKFSDSKALNRDLTVERAILEKG